MSNSREVILGAVLGSLCIGTLALFLTTPKGKKLRHEAENICKECKGKVEEFIDQVQDKTESVEENISDWTKTANQTAEWVDHPQNEKLKEGLVIGGMCGSLLGISAVLYLSHHEKKDLSHKISSHVNNLKQFLSQLQGGKDENPSTIINENLNLITDVLDLANTGLHIWTRFTKQK